MEVPGDDGRWAGSSLGFRCRRPMAARSAGPWLERSRRPAARNVVEWIELNVVRVNEVGVIASSVKKNGNRPRISHGWLRYWRQRQWRWLHSFEMELARGGIERASHRLNLRFLRFVKNWFSHLTGESYEARAESHCRFVERRP